VQFPPSGGPVVAIGLDAAEVDLVDRWMEEGYLPNMARLRSEGTWGRLDSLAESFPACVWASFHTGVHPGRSHGFTSFPLIPGTYKVHGYVAETKEFSGFFNYSRLADSATPRAAVIDMPKTDPDSSLTGVQLVNWGVHAACANPASFPSGFMDEVLSRFGKYPLAPGEEDFDKDSENFFLDIRRKLVAGAKAKAELTTWLIREGDFDLIICVCSELHAAGHRFWHFADPAHPEHDPNAPAELKEGMLDVAKALDRGIGDVLAAIPQNATLIVFSLHGMMPEYTLTDVLPRFLERWSGIAKGEDLPSGTTSLKSEFLSWLRQVIPDSLRSHLKIYAPYSLRQNFRAHHYMAVFGQKYWSRMRAFALPSDDHGYIRVNLKGREPNGFVEPGAEYESVLSELTEEMHALQDIENGDPVVRKVIRTREKWPGPYSDLMPDLVVIWNCQRPTKGMRSPTHGDIKLNGRLHMRSGVHKSEGFVLARGPQVRKGHVLNGGHALDLPPTILTALGASVPDHLDGQTLLDLFRAYPESDMSLGSETRTNMP